MANHAHVTTKKHSNVRAVLDKLNKDVFFTIVYSHHVRKISIRW